MSANRRKGIWIGATLTIAVVASITLLLLRAGRYDFRFLDPYARHLVKIENGNLIELYYSFSASYEAVRAAADQELRPQGWSIMHTDFAKERGKEHNSPSSYYTAPFTAEGKELGWKNTIHIYKNTAVSIEKDFGPQHPVYRNKPGWVSVCVYLDRPLDNSLWARMKRLMNWQ